MVYQIIDQKAINVCLFDSGVLSLFIIVKTPMAWFVVKFKWVKMNSYNKNILWLNIPLLLGFSLFKTVINSKIIFSLKSVFYKLFVV